MNLYMCIKRMKNEFKTKVYDNIRKSVIYHEFAHLLTNSYNRYRKKMLKHLRVQL